jgi:hypothetical protein
MSPAALTTPKDAGIFPQGSPLLPDGGHTMRYPLRCLALLTLALHASHAGAEDAAAPLLSFKGFGTLGVVRSGEDQADFTSTDLKPNGAGHTRRWSADVDSLLAVQADVNPGSQLSAVLQVVAEQNPDSSYRPRIEWANVKYEVTPDFSIRAGRTVLPAFLLSETRKLGYSHPWVRPPLEVYSLIPISHSDGLDLSYSLYLGEVSNTLRANVGQTDVHVAGGGKAEGRDVQGLTYTAEYGPLTVRIASLRGDVNVPSVSALFGAFRQFGPRGNAIADTYDANHKRFTFRTVGASYDPGPWFVMSEWGQVDAKFFLGKATGWYASGGYRLGQVTPFVAYARARAAPLSDPGLTIADLPPPLQGAGAALNGALNSILSSNDAQHSVSVGARWDVTKAAAVKLQFDQLHIDAGSDGVLSNPQPAFRTGGKVRLLSATLDFVF